MPLAPGQIADLLPGFSQQPCIDVPQQLQDAIGRLGHPRIELQRGPASEAEQSRDAAPQRQRLLQSADVGTATAAGMSEQEVHLELA